jgi:amidophosphoribosyltransferase
MPTRDELIAHGRSDEQIREAIGADRLVYQSIEDMKQSVRDVQPQIKRFEASCFDGVYITGDVTPEYLDRVEYARLHSAHADYESRSQLNLNLSAD